MTKTVVKTIGGVINATSILAPKYAAKKAVDLFSSPRKGRYNSEQNKVIASAFFEEVEANGHSIATYRWPGKNKTVLLAHGWESNASRWQYILEKLKTEEYNIIALDAPAHGKSNGKQFNAIKYAEFLSIVINKFQPEAVLGHSVGGMATVFCLHHNDLPSVKKVVLLGSPAHFTGVFKRYKIMMGYNKKVANGLDRYVLNKLGKPVDYFSAANFTSEFDIEGLIIHDKNDKIIPYEDGQLFASKFKNSEFISTTGFGHGLKDESLTPKIIEFINN
ncbi:alpha/beta fold hydrolase [Winogradskyella sp. A3E31]|uniref:alpha/beta fold hydrolase n=1 Tax=Winogradskyella sp. A3E31 TaxID=3349637 RepID=UPI00398B5720